MKQIFWIIMVVVVVVLTGVWYANRPQSSSVSSGQVFVHPGTGEAKADAAASAAGANGQTAQAQQPAAAAAADPPAGASESAAPDADSIRRNPANGMTFAGTGKYQVYRQGDITWRLNTETGQSCVLFATDAEWRKPRVFQRGCGGS
jgi:uncharacterized iron-regulated membrane protein